MAVKEIIMDIRTALLTKSTEYDKNIQEKPGFSQAFLDIKGYFDFLLLFRA